MRLLYDVELVARSWGNGKSLLCNNCDEAAGRCVGCDARGLALHCSRLPDDRSADQGIVCIPREISGELGSGERSRSRCAGDLASLEVVYNGLNRCDLIFEVRSCETDGSAYALRTHVRRCADGRRGLVVSRSVIVQLEIVRG